jgi:hypothetical protein
MSHTHAKSTPTIVEINNVTAYNHWHHSGQSLNGLTAEMIGNATMAKNHASTKQQF